MRILHTSDWHIGRTLHGVDLNSAHAAYFDHLVETVAGERVAAVLVAGDVYDRALPSVESVELLEEVLLRLTALTRVVITPGNHDSAIRLGFGSALFRDRLSIRSKPVEAPSPVVIPDVTGDGSVWVYAVPYLDPDTTRYALGETDENGVRQPLARSHEAVTTAVMNRVRRDLTQRRNGSGRRIPAVLMAHGFVVGGQACDSERDIRVGGVDSVPHSVFGGAGESLDYVALGHLHGPQRVGPKDGPGPRLRYSGSPVAFSFSEMHHRKSSTLVEFGADGAVTTAELVEAPVTRRLSEVRGDLGEVLGTRFQSQRDDWVRVIVTGDHRPNDLASTIKRAFPHALEVHFEPNGGVSRLPGPRPEVADPLVAIGEFVEQVSNRPPDEREQFVLQRAYEAVLAGERSR
ncbi:MAG: exonuclease SbcCD subunit D [Propionicimonas sp.]